MIIRRLFLLILLGVASLTAGEYGDAFLLASLNQQAQALGNSAVSCRVNSGSALINPAGLARLRQPQANLVYESFTGLATNLGFETVLPLKQEYRLGLTVIHSGVGDLFFRPDLGLLSPEARRDSVLSHRLEQGESIAYREDAVFLSLAREFSFTINLGWKLFKIPCRLPLGVSVKYLDKLLVDNRGLGAGFDLGGQLIFNLAGMTDILSHTQFAFGMLASDLLNTPVYWESKHQDAIKRNVTRGYSIAQEIKKYAAVVTFSSSVQSHYRDDRRYGLELALHNLLFVRGGYDGNTPSFGLGIGLKKFIIDYSFSQHELSEMQKIGMIYRF